MSFKAHPPLILIEYKTMASQHIIHIDARRFMSRPPRAYRQLSQTEKRMVDKWYDRPGNAFVHKHGFLLYYDLPIMYVALIFVERSHRGKGIATALLNKCSTPCMATVLDNRLWEKLGWEVVTVVPGCVTVAVNGMVTPEHRELFDAECAMMALQCRLPLRIQARIVHDHELADSLQHRLVQSVDVMIGIRKTLMSSGMSPRSAMRSVIESCLEATGLPTAPRSLH